MHWFRVSGLLLLCCPAWAAEGFIIGLGVETDSEDTLAGIISAELAVTETTWLSAAIAKTRVDLPRDIVIDTLYADVGVDHWFDPVGVRFSVAYWGDKDILDSNDFRGSLYWRNDKLSLAADLEYRDFSFDIFRDNLRPGQDFEFNAQGVGLSARVDVSDNVDISVSAIGYDYSVNLRLDPNRPILDFLSASRLSLLNSLIDYRARVGLGIDAGQRRWSFELATWKGEVIGSKTNSATIRFLTPMGNTSDVEFALGYDSSDDFGAATIFSVFVYFYG